MNYTLRIAGLCMALLFSTNSWSQDEPEWLRIQPFEFIAGILDIHIDNNGNGYVVGNRGFIYRTNDNGDTWELQESGIISDIKRIEALPGSDTQTAFALGNPTLQTTNGGQTWTPYDPDDLPGAVAELVLLNDDQWIAAGLNSRLYRTLDGGQTWFDLFGNGVVDNGKLLVGVGDSHAFFLDNAGILS